MNTPEDPLADVHYLGYRIRRPEDAPVLNHNADILSFSGTDTASRPGVDRGRTMDIQPQRVIEADDPPEPDDFDNAG